MAKNAKLFHNPKYDITFHTVKSERFEKTNFHLQAYQATVAQILSEHSVKDYCQNCHQPRDLHEANGKCFFGPGTYAGYDEAIFTVVE